MLNYLENEYVQISVDSMGAELHNIKSKADSTEYLWGADNKHWGFHAPSLFPIVGRLKNDTLKHDGKAYHLERHGFARKTEFTLIEKSETFLTYELRSTEETKKCYPFDFIFKIKYSLQNSGVAITYLVENKNDSTMYFSVGAHPAFNCPLEASESFNDYYLEFNQKETARLMPITPDGYIGSNNVELLNNKNVIELEYSLFKNDALVFSGLRSDAISIKSRNHNKSTTVTFGGFPYLGIWTKIGAPFICIEPWFGHADFHDFNSDFSQKSGIQKLNSGEVFSCTHTITVF